MQIMFTEQPIIYDTCPTDKPVGSLPVSSLSAAAGQAPQSCRLRRGGTGSNLCCCRE